MTAAFAEVAVVLLVVDGGWTAAPWVGVGGAVGVTAWQLAPDIYWPEPYAQWPG